MERRKKDSLFFSLKLLIPLIIIISLFIGGVSTGIITFEKPEDDTKIQNNQNNRSAESAIIKIYFNDDSVITFNFTTMNISVYDYLLKASEIGNFTVKSTYWEQYDSYVIDSITYNEVKYEADSGNYWAYYVNGNYGTVSADKQIVKNNDVIEWKYEKF